MSKTKAAVILMIDAEGEFSRIAFNPKDNLLHKTKMLISRLLNLDYSINTFVKMLNILNKYNFPATLFIVGSLYLEKKNKYLLKEYLKSKPKTRYLFKNNLFKIVPCWGSYIKKQRKNKLFDFGIHNFLHESNFAESDKQISRAIEYSVKAAKTIGITPKTYAAPWFKLEEAKNPTRVYNILKKNGITATRFDGIKETEKNTITKSESIKKIFSRYGINCINGSHFIGNGKINKEEYRLIKKGIEKAIKTNTIYAISTHDTTFVRHGIKHFENIIKLIKSYNKRISITTLSAIAGKR